ncbi:flippase [Hafnia alvei]|uniref:Putative O-antigen transporter n=1 Tax=Hafnia alvei TaxID=569 RepID=A0A172X0L8_HAFAL|nr:flippase [Hafnia alvei]ANF30176.1 putative O-antigen transporter [Hafnia alvei]TBM13613.1 flippase [Hafnia alvei]
MKVNTSLNRNIFYLALVQGSSFILPLLTFPYLVRVLGPESFGVLGFCQASMQYLVLLTEYGFNWTATQQVAINNKNKSELTKIFWSVIFSKLVLACIAFSILIIACYFIPKYQQLWFVLLSLSPMVIGNIIYPIWFFQGMEKMKWISLCSISARFLLVPLTFVFVHGSNDLWIAALIQGGTNFVAGLIGFALIFKNRWVGVPILSFSRIKKSLSDGWHIFVSTSAISMYTTSTTVILGFLAGPIAVGYFNAANTIRNATQSLLNPISQALYPRVNTMFSNDYAKAMRLIKSALRYFSGISLISSIFLFLLAPWIIKYGVGEKYEASISVLRWMAFLPFVISLSNIFGVQTMLAHNYKKEFSHILIMCGICNLIFIFPLIYLFKQDGAAISVLLTEIGVASMMYLFLRKKRIYLFKG